jgi:hypothetical protein
VFDAVDLDEFGDEIDSWIIVQILLLEHL